MRAKNQNQITKTKLALQGLPRKRENCGPKSKIYNKKTKNNDRKIKNPTPKIKFKIKLKLKSTYASNNKLKVTKNKTKKQTVMGVK